MKLVKQYLFLLFVVLFTLSCSNDDGNTQPPIEEESKEIVIFHINDQHGRLNNFSKIKYIIDEEKMQSNVFLVCAGDIFSGNPVVDNHDEKGFPMIDLMNKVGFDISVIGNHEFDYGEVILKDRFNQSQFEWVCANVDMNDSGIPQPSAFKTIAKDGVKITFLGLVETNGKEDDIIPSTHPWRVQNLTFQEYGSITADYETVKTDEQSDLYIALTHLGNSSDEYLAKNFPYFDLIIGGHSHSKDNEVVNNIPIVQAGSNLNYLGKISLTIKDKQIESFNYELIDLDKYSNYDADLKTIIDTYNDEADLDEIIGYSDAYHSRSGVGSFYTDALRMEMNVDISFQNTGGVRNTLDEGDILKGEIYTIDPFNNGSVMYTMTVKQIKDFLKGSRVAIYYAGVQIEQENGLITISKDGKVLKDSENLILGLNDYIPAVYDSYFTQEPTFKPYTTAEAIISYLESTSASINYSEVNNFFQFQ